MVRNVTVIDPNGISSNERNEPSMSASREKKNRQTFAASGAVDPKAVRAAEEKAKQRKSNILYISVAVAFVLVAAFVLIWNSAALQRSKTALTIGETKYTTAQVQYAYYAAYNDVRSSSYVSYMGLDTSKSLSSQTLSDTAKALLGVTDQGSLTWSQYLLNKAKSDLQATQSLRAAADKENYTWTDHMQAEYDKLVDTVKSSAKNAGYSYKNYIKAMYGSLVTPGVFEDMTKTSILLSDYQNDYKDSLTYTDEEISQYYEDHKSTFDVAAYDYIRFTGSATSTKDASGNTVEPTDEQTQAAKDAAKAAADAALARFQNGEDLETISKDYDIASFVTQDEGSNGTDTVSAWVFDITRTPGESAVIDDGTNYYVVHFKSMSRQEYNTIDVRHILARVDSSSLDKKSDTYEQELADLKAQKKAEAEKIYQEWKDGEATEESFAALADKYSADSPEGGLYTQVYHNMMVTEFNDWCFDAARQPGDTDIVETTYGYHIMYFVGQDLPYWQVRVTNTLKTNDFNDWYKGLQQDYTVTEGSGMKFVG